MPGICYCGNACLMVCSNCKLVRYCSKTCQKKDWLSHKSICFNSLTANEATTGETSFAGIFYNKINDKPKNIHSLANEYLMKNDPQTAMTLLNKCKTVYDKVSNREESIMRVSKAVAFTMLNEDEKAVKEIRKAIQICPENSSAYNHLAMYYYKANKINIALTLQKRAITLNPTEPKLIINYCKLLKLAKLDEDFEIWSNILLNDHFDFIQEYLNSF